MRCFNVAFREDVKSGNHHYMTLYCAEVDFEKATFLCYNTLHIALHSFDYHERSELICIDSGDLFEAEFDENGYLACFKIY